MKVLFNASMYSEKPTGVGIHTREIWKNLLENEIEEKARYTICSYSNYELNANGKWFPIRLPFVLQFLFKKFLSLHRLIWNLFFLPFVANKYDLVYSFSSHGSPFIKNQIITIHDLICFSFPKQHKFQFLYFKYILPSIIKASKKIVVVSEFTKREVIKFYKTDPDKIIVIRNGGDHLKQHSETYLSTSEKKIIEELSGKNFFLTVGATYPHKNIERLIEAMMALSKSFLVIVGTPNDYYKKLQRLTKQKKLVNILFLNYVSPELLKWLYKNCIANVYISLYEGFGFPPFEAALQNKLSVISNMGSLPEIYEDVAYYVNALNTKDISDALRVVASTDFSFYSYQKKFPALISKFKWSNAAREVEKLILTYNKKEKTETILQKF